MNFENITFISYCHIGNGRLMFHGFLNDVPILDSKVNMIVQLLNRQWNSASFNDTNIRL